MTKKLSVHSTAPLNHLSPHSHVGASLLHSDTLMAHHLHLESLMDSALATLTLIWDSAPTNALPALTGHMTEVLRALCRHTHGSPCPTPDPLDLTPTPTPSPPPALATYAEAVAVTATDPVTTDNMHMPTHTPPPSERLKAHTPNPDLVSHIDRLPHTISARPPPFKIFSSLRTRSIIGDLQLAGVRWTLRGNLTVAFLHGEIFTMEEAVKQAAAIWDFVCPLLHLPKHCYP
jgi:hypothetical protein